jgi:hypothetical protein
MMTTANALLKAIQRWAQEMMPVLTMITTDFRTEFIDSAFQHELPGFGIQNSRTQA